MGIDTRLLVKVKGIVTPEKVTRWAYELAGAFGHENFGIIRPDNEHGFDPQHALEITKEFTQDGDSIKPKRGETLIECHLWTRYYGKGYERGDIGLIIGVSDWLEKRIPESEIWYGGDSSRVCATLFDEKARRKLWNHFVQVGHDPYENHFSGDDSKICDFCKLPMRQYGFGANYAAYFCKGCGWNIETRDGGTTFKTVKNER